MLVKRYNVLLLCTHYTKIVVSDGNINLLNASKKNVRSGLCLKDNRILAPHTSIKETILIFPS